MTSLMPDTRVPISDLYQRVRMWLTKQKQAGVPFDDALASLNEAMKHIKDAA